MSDTFKAVPIAEDCATEPGRVTSLKGKEAVLGVGTGAGVLAILKLQLEGKKAMSAADFLRGHRELPGVSLAG